MNENDERAAASIALRTHISEAEQATTLRHQIIVAIADRRVQSIDIDENSRVRRVEFFPDIQPALIEAVGAAPDPAEAATDVKTDGQD